MKIVGLITEYNPFHNGHLYHIEEARRLTGADSVIAVMSGNYVQRGAPAILPKRLRASMALHMGVSVVIELPVAYAAGSAEYFAEGAVSILDQLGCIDSICFGSECGDIALLEELAGLLAEEPDDYRNSLKEALHQGHAYPKARQMALVQCLGESSGQVLEKPNNILGIEYLKALYRRNSKIRAYTIARKDSKYHDTELTECFSSATAIRKELFYGSSCDVLTQIPPVCSDLMQESIQNRQFICADDFSLLLKYALLQETPETLCRYQDVSEDLANRIWNNRNYFQAFEQFCELLKTKELTYSRISRSLLHILLRITKNDIVTFKKSGGCRYARILGFRNDSTASLSYIKKHSSIPLLTKLKQCQELDEYALHMLKQDIFASDLYESVRTDRYQIPFCTEYQQQILRI
ncbi:nucleotidyltransferase [Faecalicatena contorta]|uniref:nucleotidyltransferase n=1 Tax=Faecalicatena contorta TaxID=39482 RepID=UPI001F3F0544|nr:nucleotidyltransferase [Faecalicatena contorta]MCF2681715.1 nucleotidyltransferase [Faecalicatena contorta]